MFRKRPNSHFIGEYSYGRISQLSKHSDGKHRQVHIEYLSPSQEEVDEGDIQTKPQFKTTLRESRDLIVLFPITDTLNEDLATLHRDIEDYDKSLYRDINIKEVKSFFTNPCKNVLRENRCQACLNARNLPKNPCNICLLIEESRNIQEYNIQLVDKTGFIIREMNCATDVLEKMINSIKWKLVPEVSANQLRNDLMIKIVNHSSKIHIIKNNIIPRGIFLKLLIRKGPNIQEIIYIVVNKEDSVVWTSPSDPSISIKNNEVEGYITANYKRNMGKDLDIKFVTSKIKWPRKSYSLDRSLGKGDLVTCYCKYYHNHPFSLNPTYL